MAEHPPGRWHWTQTVCSPIPRDCIWNQLDNVLVRSLHRTVERKTCLFFPQARQMPSHRGLSGRARIMRHFETTDIVRKTETGKRAKVVSDYFSKEQWNTKWISVWVKSVRWGKEVCWELFTTGCSSALMPGLIVMWSWCMWTEIEKICQLCHCVFLWTLTHNGVP